MDELVEFLRARLNEDEQVAGAAKPGPWHADGGSVYATHPIDQVVDYTDSAAHIARHDPMQVLREVEARRGVIRIYEQIAPGLDGPDAATRGTARVTMHVLKPVLCHLAKAYANHPEYRAEAWVPEI